MSACSVALAASCGKSDTESFLDNAGAYDDLYSAWMTRAE
jgi:hypothetical protein